MRVLSSGLRQSDASLVFNAQGSVFPKHSASLIPEILQHHGWGTAAYTADDLERKARELNIKVDRLKAIMSPEIQALLDGYSPTAGHAGKMTKAGVGLVSSSPPAARSSLPATAQPSSAPGAPNLGDAWARGLQRRVAAAPASS